MKTCFKCGETKSLDKFYKHKYMKDGHLNKCITCSVSERRIYRKANLDKIHADNKRYAKKYMEVNKQKYRTRYATTNKIRDGKLHPQPCSVCGSEINIHAHHNDYSKPLEVVWLCYEHHMEMHRASLKT